MGINGAWWILFQYLSFSGTFIFYATLLTGGVYDLVFVFSFISTDLTLLLLLPYLPRIFRQNKLTKIDANRHSYTYRRPIYSRISYVGQIFPLPLLVLSILSTIVYFLQICVR